MILWFLLTPNNLLSDRCIRSTLKSFQQWPVLDFEELWNVNLDRWERVDDTSSIDDADFDDVCFTVNQVIYHSDVSFEFQHYVHRLRKRKGADQFISVLNNRQTGVVTLR